MEATEETIQRFHDAFQDGIRAGFAEIKASPEYRERMLYRMAIDIAESAPILDPMHDLNAEIREIYGHCDSAEAEAVALALVYMIGKLGVQHIPNMEVTMIPRSEHPNYKDK